MKKTERFTKALAITGIITLSLAYNMKDNVVNKSNYSFRITETGLNSDTLKVSETRFVDFTKSFIKQEIKRFIINL